MKRIYLALAALLFVGASVQAQNPAGDWQGVLDVNGTSLKLVVHISGESGALKATIDSPDQGASGIPVAYISVANSVLKLDVSAVGGSYEGHISADGQTIDGTWTQGGGTLSLVLKRQSATVAAAAPAKKRGAPVFPDEETWLGTLDAGSATFHLVLHLAKADGGGLRASLDSVDQNAYGITVTSATEKDSTLKLEFPGIGASFEGHVAADRRTIDGTWSQSGGSLPLLFTRKDAGVATAPPKGVAGVWQGILEAVALRLQLHVFAVEDGKFTGKLDSLDQGANGLACDNLSLKASAFHFEVPSVGGTYDGTLNAAADEIIGTWTQHGVTRTLNFKRGDKPAAQRRPQNPTPPYPYRVEEVNYPSTEPGITLAGTLTIPRGRGPFPAALLIAGSGPQTRDEVVAGHNVFLVLADSLTRKGILVLRADKRGVGKSTGNYALATSADFADDAEAGVAYLKTRKEINPREIGLIGHSEGGIVAPMVASRSSDVAWIVILAGGAIKGERILLLQGQLISKAGGASDADADRNADLQRASFAILHQEKDGGVARRKLAELYESDAAAQKLAPAARQTSIQFLTSPWVRYFLDYDPAPALAKTRCPVLALYGSKDLQVPAAQNLPVLKMALAEGGNKDVQAEELPDLNHLFQHAKSGSPNEYGGIEETMAPAVLDEVSGWILKHAAGTYLHKSE